MALEWMQRKQLKHSGLHDIVNRSLMVLEDAAGYCFWAKETDTKTWRDRDSSYEAAESKSMRVISYQKNQKVLLKIKESRLSGYSICIPFTASPHVQLSHDAKRQKWLLG